MDLIHSSDPRVVFALWLGITVVVTSTLLLLLILLMRQWAERRDRNQARAAAFWRTVLVDAMQTPPLKVPPLPAGDLVGFVEAWNELHGEIDGAANPGMREVAGQVGLEQRLQQLLSHSGFHNRVMAIMAMGYLRSQAHFDKLARFLEDRSPIVSLSAAAALMRINEEEAVKLVVPQIMAREDWVQGGVASVLQQGDPAIVSNALGGATLQANDSVSSRLVRFLAGVSPQAAEPVVRRILKEAHDDHLVSTCLQVIEQPQDVGVVQKFLEHPRWHVRMHAAAALGRLGTATDTGVLLPMLTDAQWWVRYRAAQALGRLTANDRNGLQRVRAGQSDRFACDILDQVIAERAMGGAQ